jgi:acetyl-CoA carboxylase biotin carboxyl carrier protein
MALSDDDVREILRIIDESELDELLVETDGFRLHVRRGGEGPRTAEGGPRTAETPAAAPTPPPSAVRTPPSDGLAITSPMLGTFYRAEAPGAAPFVDVGANVDADTTVCLIEVMKMMNSVPAGVAGTIVEVCAENAEVVEYGQPLFRVEP